MRIAKEVKFWKTAWLDEVGKIINIFKSHVDFKS